MCSPVPHTSRPCINHGPTTAYGVLAKHNIFHKLLSVTQFIIDLIKRKKVSILYGLKTREVGCHLLVDAVLTDLMALRHKLLFIFLFCLLSWTWGFLEVVEYTKNAKKLLSPQFPHSLSICCYKKQMHIFRFLLKSFCFPLINDDVRRFGAATGARMSDHLISSYYTHCRLPYLYPTGGKFSSHRETGVPVTFVTVHTRHFWTHWKKFYNIFCIFLTYRSLRSLSALSPQQHVAYIRKS